MRINSLSLVVSFPLLVLLAILLPMALTFEYQYIFPWLMIPLILVIIIYFFRPQIDFWWIRRNPLGLEQELITWLSKNSKYYKSLGSEEKRFFENKAKLYMHSMDFTIKAMEDHPVGEEFKLIAIHEALRITKGLKNYMFASFDRIILYPHSFPSPQHKHLHTTEIHEEDGVVLMSQPHLVNGLLFPNNYFNLGLFTWINVFIRENPRLAYPKITDSQFMKLNDLMPFTIEQIKEVIGHHFVSPLSLHMYVYFDFQDEYKEKFSKIFPVLNSIFNEKQIL